MSSSSDSKAIGRVKRKPVSASDSKAYIDKQIKGSIQRQISDRIRESIIHEDGTPIIPKELVGMIVSFMWYTVMTIECIREEIPKLLSCVSKVQKDDEKLNDEYDDVQEILAHYTEASILTTKSAHLIPMAMPSMDTGLFMKQVFEPALARKRQSNECLNALDHSRDTLIHFMALVTFAKLPYQAFELFGKVNSYTEFTICGLSCKTVDVDTRTEEPYDIHSDEDDRARQDYCVDAYHFVISIGDHTFRSGYITFEIGQSPCMTPVDIESKEPRLLELTRYLRLDGRDYVSLSTKLYTALQKCFQISVSGAYNPDMALELWNRLSARGLPVNAIVLIMCLFRITESVYSSHQYAGVDTSSSSTFHGLLNHLADPAYLLSEELDTYQAMTAREAKVAAAAATADAIASREHKKRKLTPPNSSTTLSV